ncbi:hypothetical protein [Bacillus haynesii]|nr:hypothetical protein [Bacillus haynesii]MCY7859692.1 hypothetical protein [Bacillus haynesii]MCY9151100.1 hypothetical protein [Bacillus haynesii]
MFAGDPKVMYGKETGGPGDEPLESLGAELKLPEWLDSIACKLKAFF